MGFIKRLLRNRRVKYLLAHAPHMLLGVALVLIFSRLVPTEEFGVFARSFAFVNIGGALLYGWLQISVLRFADGVESKRPPRWSALVLASLLPVPLLLGLAFLMDRLEIIEYPAVTALATAAYSLSVSLSQYARGLNNAFLYGLIGAVRMGGVLIFAFLAINRFPDSRALILALAVGAFASLAVGLAYICFSKSESLPSRNNALKSSSAISLRDMLAYGAPASLSLASVMLLIHADRFVASYFLNAGDLGLYSAQVDLARQMVYPIISAIGVSLLPTAIRLEKDQGRVVSENYVFKESSFLLALVAPLIALAVFYSAEIYRLLLPVEYATPIGWAGSITALGAAFTGLRLLRFDPLFQLSMQKEKVFYSAVSGLIAWVVLAWPLAYLSGANGLASLGLIAALVSCLVAFYLAKCAVPISRVVTLRSAFALVVCCAVVLMDRQTDLFAALGGIAHLMMIAGLMLFAVVIALKMDYKRRDV